MPDESLTVFNIKQIPKATHASAISFCQCKQCWSTSLQFVQVGALCHMITVALLVVSVVTLWPRLSANKKRWWWCWVHRGAWLC